MWPFGLLLLSFTLEIQHRSPLPVQEFTHNVGTGVDLGGTSIRKYSWKSAKDYYMRGVKFPRTYARKTELSMAILKQF